MNVTELYKEDYQNHCDLTGSTSKYGWLANSVFELATYDDSLDELFGKKIVEVCKVLLIRATYEYIRDGSNYIPYILVCNMLDRMRWISWGTSIRGAWFQEENFGHHQSKPILIYLDKGSKDGYAKLPFTVDNLIALIEFVESE